MSRSILAVLLLALSSLAAAQSCTISGTAYDAAGRKQPNAIVRLTNLQTHRSSYGFTDADAAFTLPGESGQTYRLDILGPAYRVTGSHIPTRSVVGMTEFSCRGAEHHDVRAAES